MAKLKYIGSICAQNFYKWGNNPRIWVLGILFAIFTRFTMEGIPILCYGIGYRITPWIFPHYTSTMIIQLVMMLGLVMLFCDAPFMDIGSPYLIIRSGRVGWALGQILYIILASALYFLVLMVFCDIWIIGDIAWINSWGKILTTMARTNLNTDYRTMLQAFDRIIMNYTPLQAMGYSFILCWACGTVLGLIMFVINMLTKRSIGIMMVTILCFMDIGIVNVLSSQFFWYSPVTLSRLSALDSTRIGHSPTVYGAMIELGLLILVFSILGVFLTNKRSIHTLPPV